MIRTIKSYSQRLEPPIDLGEWVKKFGGPPRRLVAGVLLLLAIFWGILRKL